MTTILAALNALILLAISFLHFYWMFGGKWGFAQSLPTNAQGERLISPGAVACGVAAMSLLGVTSLFIHGSGLPFLSFSETILRGGMGFLAVVFLLRAIGYFKFESFTKSIKQTEFGQLDTLCYSPLCLFLGLSSAILAKERRNNKLNNLADSFAFIKNFFFVNYSR
jgi:hypothetical protein